MVNKRDKNEGAKKPAASTAPKSRIVTKPKAIARTASAAPAAKPRAAKKKAAEADTVRQEDIAFRAYLIAEKRQQIGLPGDALSDWVEAERQLLGGRATHGVN